MFGEEVDWLTRFRRAGWKVLFFPGAEVMHVGGASHGGTMYVENLRGHLRWFDKHRGPREAERARRLLLAACGPRRRPAARAAHVSRGRRFLALRRRPTLLRVIDYLRLAFGTLCVLAPGWAVARAFGQRRAMSAVLAWASPSVFVAWAAVFAVHRSIHLAVAVLAVILVGRAARVGHRSARPARDRPQRSAALARRRRPRLVPLARRGRGHRRRPLPRGTRAQARRPDVAASAHVDEFRDGGLHPGYAFPLWHGLLALVSWFSGVDPGTVVRHEPSLLAPIAVRVAWEAGVAVFGSRAGRRLAARR